MKIYFENLQFGTVDFRIEDNYEMIIDIWFSHIAYNSLKDLVGVLRQLVLSQKCEIKVIFFAEPTEFEFIFHKNRDILNLNIFLFHDSRRVMGSSRHIFHIIGDIETICLPFWRALRSLQSKYSEEEFNELWRSDFSYKELDDLTAMIKTRKQFS